MFQLQLQVVYKTKDGTISRQIPTFFLETHFISDARSIVSDMFFNYLELHGTIMHVKDGDIYHVDNANLIKG